MTRLSPRFRRQVAYFRRRTLLPGLAALLLAAAFPAPAAEETLEAALQSLEKAPGDLDSWSVDYVMLMNAQGMTIPTEGRMEVRGTRVRNEMSVDVMGQNMKVLAITGEDGVTWTESDVFGQKMVMKTEPDGSSGGGALAGMTPASNEALVDPRRVVALIRDQEGVVFLGREELEGTEVLSFEMPLDPALRQEIDATGQLAQLGVQPEKIQAMIAPSDGFPRLWQMVDAAGKALVSVIYRDIRINPEIPAERFAYTPPTDTNVMDMSALAEGLLSNLGDSDALASSPEVQQLLGELNLSQSGDAAGDEPEEEEPDASKYNQKYLAGQRAPGFKAAALEGGSIDLGDYEGKIVLLDFWATWSEPYVRNLNRLTEVYKLHGGEEFEIIGINLDTDREAVTAFLQAHPEVSWPQVFDGKGWSNEVGTLYEIEAIPHRILIGRDGVILKTGPQAKFLPGTLDELLSQ